LDIRGARINRFVRQTKALAVCGYRESVDIVKSAAFELLVFEAFQRNTLTLHGARAMKRTIQSQASKLSRDLGFRMVVRAAK
jgi:DNA-binding transcriptional regulator/RsmH inhibitor MraZ